jgi:beta-N-acetylhexosaminidase
VSGVSRPCRLFATTLAALLAIGPLFAAVAGGGGALRPDPDGVKWAKKTLRKLTLEEKVGQLFMVWARARFSNAEGADYTELRDRIRKYHIGSVAMTVPVEGSLLSRTGPYEAAMLLNRLQADSKLPLLVAADFERGLSTRLMGSTVFPHAMAFGAAGRPEHAETFGRITAEEARAVGVHLNFFPVADVNSNPKNPIINTRSFGEDPTLVGDLVAAYVRGAHAGGLLTTAKHFPGHGDTDTDSHFGMARVNGDRSRLDAVELPPFRRAIAAGIDAVMVAHVAAPALEPDPERVATTSAKVVTALLKNELGFKGLVVTDALDMAGLTQLYAKNVGRAAVEAFKAGNDLLIIPADLDASYLSMLEAARSGEIPAPRIDEAVLKLLELKASLRLHKERQVDVGQLATRFGSPKSLAAGQEVADAAVALVRENGKVLPLTRTAATTAQLPYNAAPRTQNRLVALLVTRDLRGEAGRVFEAEIRARVPDANIVGVDPRTAGAFSDEILRAVGEAQAVIAAVYVVPEPGEAGQGTGAITTLLQAVLERAAERTVVVALGSPYLAASFPSLATYLCTFSDASVSERSAVKALFGEIPIRGRLPVTIPGIAARGAGLDRELTK